MTEPAGALRPQTAGRAPGWSVVAASVCGVGHERTGQECQDAHHWRILPERLLVAAVADGAGSAPLGRVGALLAGRTAVEALARELQARAPPRKEKDWRTLLTGVLGESRAALQEQAVARDVALRDLATTLILVAAGPGWIAAAQVGDGAAVAREAAGNARALTRPGSEEYLNQTVFLTAENALSQPQIVLWRGAARQVALFSDGLQMLALRMPGGEPHAPFFTPLFAFAESATDPEAARRELEGFLRSPRITGRTDDDLTLLLATLKR